MKYGNFQDDLSSFSVSNPETPRPWINYLGNRRLRAFISQNAGGLMWYLEPYTRRISRYHYTAAPGDRPGFYIYLRDLNSDVVWNPHFAPTCTPLDSFEAVHQPGISSFKSLKDDIEVSIRYGIPPDDDVMLWDINIINKSNKKHSLQAASYLEFGILEFMREMIGWCYLKGQFSLKYDHDLNAICYDYHVFEAPYSPEMAFSSTDKCAGWDCSRDAFIGRTGSLESPTALKKHNDLSNSDLPQGGHACATLGINIELAAGESKKIAYFFALAPEKEKLNSLLTKYQDYSNVFSAFEDIKSFWDKRLRVLQVKTGNEIIDRFINIWNPYNCVVALETARSISTDHMGTDALRFRDTTQDALAVSHIDLEFAKEKMRQVLAQQTSDGGGCMTFFPYTNRQTTDSPHRSDNTVWPIYTIEAIIAESGDSSILEEVIPYRDSSEATVYVHLLNGLKHIYMRRGPNGLPTMFHADWNDGLALFEDEAAESVMLGFQLVYSCKKFAKIAARQSEKDDIQWCEKVIDEMTKILNSEKVWDGNWYRRLLLSDGKLVGSASSSQGKIFLNPQSWSVISGVGGLENRSQKVMHEVKKYLETPYGLTILAPPYAGFPEPEDPPKGSNAGVGENGAIFCHANTWAIIAECLLGNGDRAFDYYQKLLPENIISQVGEDHYEREPYVYVSSIVGPGSDNFGKAGISWLTGTASWMYVAFTQYILGIKPSFEGLIIDPCLPKSMKKVTVSRNFRDCRYEITIFNEGKKGAVALEVDNISITGNLIPPVQDRKVFQVRCYC